MGGQQRHRLGEVHGRAAAQGDHAVRAAFPVEIEAGQHLVFVRVGEGLVIHGDDRPLARRGLHGVRHAGGHQAGVCDQQGALHAEPLQRPRQFAHRAEVEMGRVEQGKHRHLTSPDFVVVWSAFATKAA
jgi:hypothetical protein